jgi:hypothetical protein
MRKRLREWQVPLLVVALWGVAFGVAVAFAVLTLAGV